MKKIRCQLCDGTWIVKKEDLEKQKVCPYCGASVQGKVEFEAYDSLDKAIYGAITKMGEGVLQNLRQMSGFMLDTAPNLKKEIRIFSKTVTDDYVSYIRTIFNQNLAEAEMTTRKLKQLFIEEEGLSESWADMICDGLHGALLYYKGIGCTRLAFEYYKKAADKEYPPAEYALGQMYYFGQDCEKNDQEALYWISKAAKELDDSDAYVVLAMVLKESEDEDVKDEGKAFLYAKRAAEMGDENAYNLLGTMYELGCGVEQSYENAIKYYKLAAENGVEIAFLNIGAFYQAGIGVPKDDRKAVEYFQAGANAGNMYCLNALGMCYKNGTGVQQDYKKAFGLFLDAAYAGNFAGELNTGLAYDEGQGVQEDKAEAKKWFTLAASHGSSKAMVALGFYTEKGIPDGEPDLESAFEWYLKAAEVGDHPFAAWVVGNCYSQGLMGIEIDRCTAFNGIC